MFGEDRVEDALEGTALADLGREHNFGLYVVRNAILGDHAAELMRQSKKDIERIIAGSERKHRAVALQGDKNNIITQCKHVAGLVGASTSMRARKGMRFMD